MPPYLVDDVYSILVADAAVKFGAHRVGFAWGTVGAKSVPNRCQESLGDIKWRIERKIADLILVILDTGSYTLYTAAGETEFSPGTASTVSFWS